ncbi:MAG: beta-galactosidase, partial [Verrucomicrobia bacterium]|nr:beta-galactosidase [Verrucomicrobiota bacterium]
LDEREFYFTDLPKADSPFALFYTTRDPLLWPYYEARGIQRTYDFSSANACRKYGADWRARYADLAHQRLRSWGMNTIANSSDVRLCRQDRTPYCDRFELKSPDIEGAHLGWWKFKDPFHPEFRARFRRQLAQRKADLEDPWCFGFFVDNEISWGSETALADWTLQSPATQPAKIEMVNHLQQKYGSIGKLNAAWKSNYADWDALLQPQQKLPAGAKDDCAAFTAVLTEAYFKNIREEFKAVAPNTLYLGCRFAGSTKAAVQIGAQYCDVISYNLYRHTLDDFKLPEGVDKPVMIGEFHFGALDRGMFHPSLIEVADQAARGKAYAAYIASALRHPNFIGAHWHQFGEQPTTGRFDGENLQNGLLDVCDTPYPETIAGIREVGYHLYEIRTQGKE